MPKVTQYTPNQISPAVVQQPRSNIQPADYSPIAKGLSDVGKAVGDMTTRIDTTSAESALINFEREKNDIFFNPKSGYFNTQGRNAYDNAATVSSAVVELKKKYGKDLNENSRLMFDRVAEKHITQANNDIMQHSSKGLQAWEVATIESQVENTLENASLYWNQPEKLRVQRALGEQAILDSSKITGIGSEATNEKLQTFRSAFVGGTIDAAIMKSSSDGQKMLDEHGDLLEGPAKMKLQKTIETKKEAEKTKFDAEQAVLTAGRIVNDFDDRSSIIAEVNKIGDPILRSKTMSQATHLFTQKKLAESEGRASIYEDAERHIMQGGSAETFQKENPEGWLKLSPTQQQGILGGKAAVTDWKEYSDLITLPEKELAKVVPSEHFTKLAVAERKTLITAVKSARGEGTTSDKAESQVGRTRTSQTDLAVKQLFGDKKDWNDEKINKVNAFYSLVDNEVSYRESEKGSKLTSEEYTNLLSGLTRKVVQEKSSLFWIDTSFDSILGVPLAGSKEESDFNSIPADDIPELTDFLRKNKIPVTTDNLIKLYNQVSK